MGLLKNLKSVFHDDWCPTCKEPMQETFKQLYSLPMTVGHYVSHKDPSYYIKNAVKVERKADIPAGTYAFGIIRYHCIRCNKDVVKLSVFLPVRDQEKYEDAFLFQNGELDSLINR